jgi:cyanophycinase
MSGLIVLMGGNEFRPDCEPMDRGILDGRGPKPRVVILPTAAARENPDLAAQNGVNHFSRLGARAEAAMIVDSVTARDGKWLGLIREADLVYLAGGDPVYLWETLRNSPAWEAILGIWRSGRTLAGSSAGAMVLGEHIWAPGRGWREGLGFLPGYAIIPHHARLAKLWNAEKMRSSLAGGVTLIGIDEATALLGPAWKVMGPGKVAVYKSDSPKFFTQGQLVEL